MVNPVHRDAVVNQLLSAIYPSGSLNEQEAWLGILQVIPWYTHGYLHIIDANQLDPSAPRPSAKWQERSRDAEAYLEAVLGLPSGGFASTSGLMWKHPLWVNCKTSNQKANPAGNGFRYLGAELLQRFGASHLDYREEQLLTTYFPGLAIPSVKTPAADILAVEHVGAKPVALISCKWSMRTDRVSEAQRECGHVKSAAHRVYGGIRFIVLCHEYGTSRVENLLNDPCVDAVVLVNLPVLHYLGMLTPKLQTEMSNGRLLTLDQLTDQTHAW